MMRFTIRSIAPALAAAFYVSLGSASASAQRDSTQAHPRLLGVFDEMTGAPIAGVRILDLLTGISALTTPTGTVSLFFLQDGGGLVRVQKIGYEQQTLTVAISPVDTSPITLVLRRVRELPTVVTRADSAPHYLSPALRGFEERRRRESGTFIGEDVLRKNEGRPLGNLLLGRAAGVKLASGVGGASFLMPAARCGSGGPPQVYLDGVPLSPTPIPSPRMSPPMSPRSGGSPRTDATLPFNLNEFDVSTLGAVEFYSTTDLAPIEFSHTSTRCGALLLWTRER
jgi:hypothetical protein